MQEQDDGIRIQTAGTRTRVSPGATALRLGVALAGAVMYRAPFSSLVTRLSFLRLPGCGDARERPAPDLAVDETLGRGATNACLRPLYLLARFRGTRHRQIVLPDPLVALFATF